ncbi:MAG: hypothetical protein IH849_09535 [Acidobacteria bacterium]|nr:hypothetical protein [Acidobacteriota bacterium]
MIDDDRRLKADGRSIATRINGHHPADMRGVAERVERLALWQLGDEPRRPDDPPYDPGTRAAFAEKTLITARAVIAHLDDENLEQALFEFLELVAVGDEADVTMRAAKKRVDDEKRREHMQRIAPKGGRKTGAAADERAEKIEEEALAYRRRHIDPTHREYTQRKMADYIAETLDMKVRTVRSWLGPKRLGIK